MRVDMLMPQMGESITEATILRWLKSVGDKVEKDETILEISTDKVDSEIPSPESGVIVEIKAKQEETVPVKEVIAVIETDTAAASSGAATSAPAAPEPTPTPTPAAAPAPTVTSAAGSAPSDGRFYTPVVKSLAAQNGITDAELAQIAGTGAGGRVVKADILSYIQNRGASQAPATQVPGPATSTPRQAPPAAPVVNYSGDGVKVEPMSKMRKMIANHMVMSKSTSPHVYTVFEVDVSKVAAWRKKVQRDFVARNGFKLSYTPFFLEAVARGLPKFPYINASVEGENILMKQDVNVGCAVALGTTGLIVPVIKRADQLSLAGIASSLNDLATRARDKQLKPDDTAGGTFTVTNVGTFGNIIGYPIINQPQLAILGIGTIKKRPVVVNDMIAIREMVYLTLSYDHRIIDGAMAGQFLKGMTEHLENWNMERTV